MKKQSLFLLAVLISFTAIAQNVGIGTNIPASKLHIKGSADTTQLIIDANSTQSNTHPLIKLRKSDGTDLMWIHSDDVTNTFVGKTAGMNNIAVSGTDNTFIGSDAGYLNDIGFDNTANGSNAPSNSTGDYNTANGSWALYNNTIGIQNTAIGVFAGYNVISGSDNTFVGYNTNCGSAGILTNATAVGNGTTVTSDNHVRVGNSSITSIGGYTDWTNISDGRVKKNIKTNVPGLAFINKLTPVTYNLDLDVADKIIQRPAPKDKDGKVMEPSQKELTARKEKEKIVYTGFVAQGVEKAAKELNYDFSGVDVAKNDKDLYGLRYAEFVVPLVKAVQEQQQIIETQKNDIEILKTQVAQLTKAVNTLMNK